MALKETPPRSAGYGSRRFLVDRPAPYSAEQHLLLRPSYNEYPERWPLDVGYPAPGRRGASRPKANTGDEVTLPPMFPVYPTPRTREPAIESPIPTAGLPTTGADGGDTSCWPRGETHNQQQSVPAGTTQYVHGATLQGPFIVTRFFISCDQSTGVNIGVKLYIAPGMNPGAPNSDSGIPIIRNAYNQAVEVEPEREGYEGFPNLHIPAGPHFIRGVCRNGQGGAVQFAWLVDIIYP